MNDAPDELEGGVSFLTVGLLLLAVLVALAVALPNLIRSRGTPNHVRAGRDLKTIGIAQGVFREGDREGDQNLDYGTLAELGQANLIYGALAAGTLNGYLFEATYGSRTSEFLWFATATPVAPGTTGDEFFCTNQSGVVFFTYSGPFHLNSSDCEVPAGAVRWGR